MSNISFMEKLLNVSADQAGGVEACLSGRQVEFEPGSNNLVLKNRLGITLHP